jgi:hypothetical protein
MTCHRFEISFYVRPRLCFHCHDYIWGSSYGGYRCVNCSNTHVHSQCLVYLNDEQKASCQPGKSNSPCRAQNELFASDDDETPTRPYTIDKWSPNNVREWLAVVNLHRYSDVFFKTNTNGARLLELDHNKLNVLKITDRFHQDSILLAVEELIKRSKRTLNAQLTEQETLKLNLKGTKGVDRHFLIVVTFTELVQCHFCSNALYGKVTWLSMELPSCLLVCLKA